MSDLQRHQTDDPVLRPIIESKRSGGAAPDSRTQRVWAQYNLTNNVLVHRSQNSNDDCIAVPESLVIKLVDYHHQLLGHFGKPPNPLDAVTSGLLPQRAPLSREEIHAKVRENLRHHANLRQRNQKGETTILELDDWVLLKNKVTSDTRTQQFAKFMPLYRGPYKIIAKPHPNTYQIADPVSNEIKGCTT
ncbi:unnamed protein product [Tenebrio molitor]|nr:unnamed protein product [Tenebrio molitor]